MAEKEYCNNWECPHNKNGECYATPEEKDICLNDLLEALKNITKN